MNIFILYCVIKSLFGVEHLQWKKHRRFTLSRPRTHDFGNKYSHLITFTSWANLALIVLFFYFYLCYATSNCMNVSQERIGVVKKMMLAHSELFRVEAFQTELKEIKDILPNTFKNLLRYFSARNNGRTSHEFWRHVLSRDGEQIQSSSIITQYNGTDI